MEFANGSKSLLNAFVCIQNVHEPWHHMYLFLDFKKRHFIKLIGLETTYLQVQRTVLENEMRSLGIDMDDKDNVSTQRCFQIL